MHWIISGTFAAGWVGSRLVAYLNDDVSLQNLCAAILGALIVAPIHAMVIKTVFLKRRHWND